MREGADGRRGDLIPSLLPELTGMGAVEDLSTLGEARCRGGIMLRSRGGP